MTISRTSHEVRGLKFLSCYALNHSHWSHLTRGAWIEIAATNTGDRSAATSRTSHEVRGLKLQKKPPKWKLIIVAPHTRCVD